MVFRFLMILVSISFFTSSLLEGHSKVFNFPTVSAQCSLKVLAISSLFNSKVSFSIFSFFCGNFLFFNKNYSKIIMDTFARKIRPTFIAKIYFGFKKRKGYVNLNFENFELKTSHFTENHMNIKYHIYFAAVYTSIPFTPTKVIMKRY